MYNGFYDGKPSITTEILTKVKADMVSWSAFDGKSPDGLKMYKGIDYIQQQL